jgi:hypothetical protein
MRRQRQPETDARPLDAVALSLALWLGLMVGALGLQRVCEHAALEAALNQRAPASQRAGAQFAVPPALATWGG